MTTSTPDQTANTATTASPATSVPLADLTHIEATLLGLIRAAADPLLSNYLAWASTFVHSVRMAEGDNRTVAPAPLPTALDLDLLALKLKTTHVNLKAAWKQPRRFGERRQIGYAFGWIGKARTRLDRVIEADVSGWAYAVSEDKEQLQ